MTEHGKGLGRAKKAMCSPLQNTHMHYRIFFPLLSSQPRVNYPVRSVLGYHGHFPCVTNLMQALLIGRATNVSVASLSLSLLLLPFLLLLYPFLLHCACANPQCRGHSHRRQASLSHHGYQQKCKSACSLPPSSSNSQLLYHIIFVNYLYSFI